MVNCGAIPGEQLIVNCLGMKKDLYWSHEKRKGYFEAANDGTILDEVGELHQLKLDY